MSEQIASIHLPVLRNQVLEHLQPRSGGVYVDGTLGLGGHSEAILQASAPDGRLIAFDWDREAIGFAEQRLQPYAGRFVIVRRNFAELASGLNDHHIEKIDGLLIDVGLSSLQLDRSARGFSFQRDEPLDMRMDDRRELTAERLLKESREDELADILYYYGEERQARRIAGEIVRQRKRKKIRSTGQLAELVAGAIPRRFHPKKIHVATRTFQALRIAVNGELENLTTILDEAVDYLKPGARFCVISFHSLEDRIVKRKFKHNSRLKIVTGKPVTADEEEIINNPRSRSAKLRVAFRKGEG